MILTDDVRKRCLATARGLTQEYSTADPPFDLSLLYGRYRITEVRETLIDGDAYLFLKGGTFAIEVNASVSAARRRMSLAHEIGHLILNEVIGKECFGEHSNPVVERFCNTLASELLCPEEVVRSYFTRQTQLSDWKEPVRCRTILDAARHFGVSVDVITRRVFFDLQLVPSSAALIWRYTENTKTKGERVALRVSSAWHCMPKGTFIPLNKTAPPSSVISKAFQRDGSFRQIEYVSIGTLRGNFEVEASGFMSFPYRSTIPPRRAVLSVLS